MEFLFSAEGIISLFTLMILEVVLGIDNIIFISIVSDRLPKEEQKKARLLGLALALVMRVGLLMGVSWLVGLKDPIVEISDFALSWRDLILVAGGIFLLAKSTSEIHAKVQGLHEDEEGNDANGKKISLTGAIIQIILLDIVFSFDSILTAIGLTDHIEIMIIAVIFSIIIMMVFAEKISNFVNTHPTVKVLALSFLLMIGMLLVVEGLHAHVPKGYIYASLAFSLFVEVLNLRMRKKKEKKSNAAKSNISDSVD
jgi:predicted tellurium resistance membrane protein TerC